jgi:hypothetical protein
MPGIHWEAAICVGVYLDEQDAIGAVAPHAGAGTPLAKSHGNNRPEVAVWVARRTMLKVYGFGRVNSAARGHTRDLRVLWALEEMQMPFELIGMDHPAHELNTDAYRKLNPFEQLPAIDDDGVVLTESAAILIYLAKKADKLIPSDQPSFASSRELVSRSAFERTLCRVRLRMFRRSCGGIHSQKRSFASRR